MIPFPLFTHLENTHASYNDGALDYLLKGISSGKKLAVFVASHNDDSAGHAVELMEKYGIDLKDSRIHFGQLLVRFLRIKCS